MFCRDKTFLIPDVIVWSVHEMTRPRVLLLNVWHKQIVLISVLALYNFTPVDSILVIAFLYHHHRHQHYNYSR